MKFEKGKSFITPYLRSKGFKPFGHGYCGCDWIWVLLDRKKHAYGMMGIKMADTMYDRAVTVEEYDYGCEERPENEKPTLLPAVAEIELYAIAHDRSIHTGKLMRYRV